MKKIQNTTKSSIKKNLTINPQIIDQTYKTPALKNFMSSTATNKENLDKKNICINSDYQIKMPLTSKHSNSKPAS